MERRGKPPIPVNRGATPGQKITTPQKPRHYLHVPCKSFGDISPSTSGSPVFLGDTPYSQQWCATIGLGCPVNASAITLSSHVGAHAGMRPLHYDEAASALGAVALGMCFGPGAVSSTPWRGPLGLSGRTLPTPSPAVPALPGRVLVRTYASRPRAVGRPAHRPCARHHRTATDLGVQLAGHRHRQH